MTNLTPGQLRSVARLMAEAGARPIADVSASLISGGRSNLTYVVTDGRTRWVLRTPPRVGRTPSAHDVSREHRVTSALFATDVPVAEAILLHKEESLLGVPFTISSFVPGRAFRTQEDLAALDEAALTAVVSSMVAALVSLHRVDHRAVGLETFGRSNGYAARQLRRWKAQWETVGSPDVARLAAEVIANLERGIPEQRRASIVHGDFRIDNTIIGGTGADSRVAAVVDWELATIGDPVADLAMMCAYRQPDFDLIVGAPSAWTSERLPEPDALVEAYVAAGGHHPEHWDFHRALALFKVAVIAAGIDHRRRAGSGHGPGFDTASDAVPRFLELARPLSTRA